MNEIRIFESSEFGELEVLNEEGKMYFPASACARKLGYKDVTNAIKQHCRWVVKRHLPHPQNPSKRITMNYIPEGDLYRLIVHSKLPGAERFERWVFDEVLPSIRQSGGYAPELTAFIVKTVQETVAATLQGMLPLLGAAPEKKRRMRRITSLVDQLETPLRMEVEEMILDRKLTYQGICDHLRDRYGVIISKSSLHRYASRLFDAIEAQENQDEQQGRKSSLYGEI